MKKKTNEIILKKGLRIWGTPKKPETHTLLNPLFPFIYINSKIYFINKKPATFFLFYPSQKWLWLSNKPISGIAVLQKYFEKNQKNPLKIKKLCLYI